MFIFKQEEGVGGLCLASYLEEIARSLITPTKESIRLDLYEYLLFHWLMWQVQEENVWNAL